MDLKDISINMDNILKDNPELKEQISQLNVMDHIKGVDFTNGVKFIDPTEKIKEDFQEMKRKEFDDKAKAKAEKATYDQELLETLKGIERNTSILGDIVGLLQCSNEQQQEIIVILSDIHEIEKAETPEEAESIWRKTIGKITSTIDNGDRIEKLISFTNWIYKKRIEYKDTIDPLIETSKEVGKQLIEEISKIQP